MMHPDACLQYISPAIGHGMFATRPLPAGTITYVRDPFDITFSQSEFADIREPYRSAIDRYCYTDSQGCLVLPWDSAKYVNHHCQANTLLTAFGFDIAVRDIAAGEQISNDYGLFNIAETLPLACGCQPCRQWLRPDDLDRLHPQWDAQIAAALPRVRQVAQALWPFLDAGVCQSLEAVLDGRQPCPSVRRLKWPPETGSG